MSSGQEIGILGVGGLGHLAIQFAAKLGNRVTAFTTSADKADLAVRLGAHEAVVTGRGQPAVQRPLDILVCTARPDWTGMPTCNCWGPTAPWCCSPCWMNRCPSIRSC